MIRPTAPRARQLARNAELASGHRQRSKTFIKRVDKNNNIYYTLAKKGLANEPDPNREYEFFEMPNLLLDLDAEGTRHVRSVDEGDESRMKAKWAEVPKRAAVRTRLKQFEEQVAESRRKAHEILSRPTNIWRITPHDILSAALHGGSAVQRRRARDTFLPGPDAPSDEADVRRTAQSKVIEKIRVENGIPPHAAHEDQLLLHWMILRYKSLQLRLSSCPQKGSKTIPSPSQLAQALQEQSSITGIRRLVFQCLAAGTSTATSFQSETKADANLPRHIRDACARVVSELPTNLLAHTETLVFLGNLAERLSSRGAHLGPLLCGFALQLAAQIGSLEATSAWLYRCHHTLSQGTLPSNQAILLFEDIASTLDSLQTLSGRPDASAAQRQLFLQVLTGIDEDSKLTPGSIRSFVTARPKNGESFYADEIQRRLVAAYIATLGHLGAARTIWMEWRQLSRLDGPGFTKHASEDDGLVFSFAVAMKQATHAVAAAGGEISPNASFEECVAADYHAIEIQSCSSEKRNNTPCVPHAAVCRSALDQSPEACISEIRSWRT